MASATTTPRHQRRPRRWRACPTDAISYEDLYARWERGNWRATELDFTEDARQWREDFTEFERTGGAVELLPVLLGRGRRRGQPLPLHRRRAAARSRSTSSPPSRSTRRATRSSSSASCRRCAASATARWRAACRRSSRSSRSAFARSSTASTRWPTSCARDRSPAKLAAAVTLYHVVIEASLAQPGQHFICSYLEERDQLPGVPRGHGEHRRRRAAPHRLRREAARRPQPRRPRRACRKAVARPAARSHAATPPRC